MWIFGPIILLQLSEVYFPVSLDLRRSVGSFDTPGLCLHATRAVEQVEVAENNGEAGPGNRKRSDHDAPAKTWLAVGT